MFFFFNGFKSSYAESTLEKRRKNKVETNAMQHTVRGFVHFQSSRGRGKEILTSPISIEVGREERTKPTEKASIEQPARHTNQACQPRKPSWPRKNKFQWGHFYTQLQQSQWLKITKKVSSKLNFSRILEILDKFRNQIFKQ